MPFKLSKPSPGGGKWDKDAHLDHLHVFVANDGFGAEQVETSFGESAAVKVDHVICVRCREVVDDLLVFGAALVPRLDGAESSIVVGRLGQGLAKPGRSAPWTLDDPTDEDLATAERFLERYATTLPSGKIVLDHETIAKDRDSDEPF
jgi:hypothetical protein